MLIPDPLTKGQSSLLSTWKVNQSLAAYNHHVALQLCVVIWRCQSWGAQLALMKVLWRQSAEVSNDTDDSFASMKVRTIISCAQLAQMRSFERKCQSWPGVSRPRSRRGVNRSLTTQSYPMSCRYYSSQSTKCHLPLQLLPLLSLCRIGYDNRHSSFVQLSEQIGNGRFGSSPALAAPPRHSEIAPGNFENCCHYLIANCWAVTTHHHSICAIYCLKKLDKK